eukprot:1107066_1
MRRSLWPAEKNAVHISQSTFEYVRFDFEMEHHKTYIKGKSSKSDPSTWADTYSVLKAVGARKKRPTLVKPKGGQGFFDDEVKKLCLSDKGNSLTAPPKQFDSSNGIGPNLRFSSNSKELEYCLKINRYSLVLLC